MTGTPTPATICVYADEGVYASDTATLVGTFSAKDIQRMENPYTICYLPETTSTMDAARAMAAGANNYTTVWTRKQTNARGRLGRVWRSFSDNLTVTTIVQLAETHVNPATLSYAVSLAVADTVSAFVSDPNLVRIKWPNDVLLDGMKVSGSIIETFAEDRYLVGIGINVGSAPPSHETLFPATSINQFAANPAPLAAVLHSLAEATIARCEYWRSRGFDKTLADAYTSRLWKLHEEVAVSFDKEKLQQVRGINRGLSPSGGLLLDVAGSRQEVYVGDVS